VYALNLRNLNKNFVANSSAIMSRLTTQKKGISNEIRLDLASFFLKQGIFRKVNFNTQLISRNSNIVCFKFGGHHFSKLFYALSGSFFFIRRSVSNNSLGYTLSVFWN
jgi:hypothetical protein